MFHTPRTLPRQSFTVAILTTVVAILTGCSGSSNLGPKAPVPADTIRRTANAVRVKYNVPAIATAVIDTNTITTDVVGVRKQGGNALVQPGDRFHLGSCAKAMTSTVLAMYIEEGKIKWDTRIREIFPEIASVMRPEYRDLTLEALLEMKSGLPTVFDLTEIEQVPSFPGTVTEQRLAFLKWAVQQPPQSVPGEYTYANSNYIIAGAIVEKLSGREWSTTLQERLFRPLGMTTVGYGWPATGGAAQPWGHILTTDNVYQPHDPDNPSEQLPLYMAPAGGMAMTIGDYATFVQLHLRGLRGQARLLSSAMFQRLHTPAPGEFFAPGAWGIVTANGITTNEYVGSLGTFLADVKLQASRNRAVVAITNAEGEYDGGDKAYEAMEEIVDPLLGVSSTRSRNDRTIPLFRLRR